MVIKKSLWTLRNCERARIHSIVSASVSVHFQTVLAAQQASNKRDWTVFSTKERDDPSSLTPPGEEPFHGLVQLRSERSDNEKAQGTSNALSNNTRAKAQVFSMATKSPLHTKVYCFQRPTR
jgi:hypothetical protein